MKVAFVARRTLTFAGISAVKNKSVMQVVPTFFGKLRFQIVHHSVGSFSVRQPEPVREPENVGIDGQSVAAQSDAGNDACRFVSDPAKAFEIVKVFGHFAAEPFDNIVRKRLYRDRFIMIKSRGIYEFFQGFERHFLEIRRRFCDLEQFARDDIHALISTLRRQHDRDKQLKRRVEIQFALCVGIILFQRFKKFCVSVRHYLSFLLSSFSSFFSSLSAFLVLISFTVEL